MVVDRAESRIAQSSGAQVIHERRVQRRSVDCPGDAAKEDDTTITEEGIVIEAECIGKVYAADEFDQNVWTIQGEPNTEVIISRPSTVELTCTTIVNRSQIWSLLRQASLPLKRCRPIPSAQRISIST